MTPNTPPPLAEAVLRLVLAPGDRETVSGDLLEEYSEAVLPARGRRRADWWYVAQVGGFVARANGVWAALWAVAFVARDALDQFVPTSDFHARSTVSTATAAAIFLSAGFWAAWRSQSIRAGALAGVASASLGAMIGVLGSVALLALSHDAGTLAAIDASGGLGESFTLPVIVIVPATVLATLGGVCGLTFRRIASIGT